MPVPRLLLIFSPLTVRKPCTKTLSGILRPLNFSIAGQNSVWKEMMSLPMKWTCSSVGVGHEGVEVHAPLACASK